MQSIPAQAFIDGTVREHPVRVGLAPFLQVISSAALPISPAIPIDPGFGYLAYLIIALHRANRKPLALRHMSVRLSSSLM
jgi:hypothetical protein